MRSKSGRWALVALLGVIVLIALWWRDQSDGLRPRPSAGTPTAEVESPATPRAEAAARRPRDVDLSTEQASASGPQSDPVTEEPTASWTSAPFVIRIVDDESGSPLAGASVHRQTGGSTTTDVEGNTTVEGVVEIRLAFRAEISGYVRSDWTLLSATKADAGPREIRLRRSFVLNGRVVEAGARVPIADAKLTVHAGSGSAVGADPALSSAVTDEARRFSVDLGPGRYELTSEGVLPVDVDLTGDEPVSVELRRK